MADYPVHNYGTDPIGKLGAHMLTSEMDWDNKKKELEQKAMIDLLKSNRELMGKQAETGSLPPGYEGTASKLGITQSVIQGMGIQSEQAKKATEIKNAVDSAKIGESVGKSIAEILKVGNEYGTSQQKQINNMRDLEAKGLIPEGKAKEVTENTINYIMPVLEKSGLSKEYGALLEDGIRTGKISEAYKTVVSLEIAKNSALINDPKSTLEEKASAFGKNKSLAVSSGLKPEEIKMIIGGDNEAFQASLKDTLTPKEEKAPTAYGEFSKGYTAFVKRQHPDWTPEQVAMEVSNESQRRGIEKGVTINVARGESYGNIRPITVIDKLNPDPKTSQLTMNMNQFNELNAAEPGRYVQASQAPEQREAMTAAGQRAGMRSANVQTAYKVFSAEAPELIALREKVQKKGLLPEGIKDIGALNQWTGKKINDPDVAELQKKTKLLADTLQRTIGGTQGGQWAFEVAADILDPTYSTPAFTRIITSHTKTFKRMSDAYKEFGTEQKSVGVSITPPKNASEYLQNLGGR